MKKSIFFVILMAIFPISAFATTPYQHELASVVMDKQNAAFMLKTVNEKVYLITFDYKPAAESCKFLQKKGVNVINVKNYKKNKENQPVLSSNVNC